MTSSLSDQSAFAHREKALEDLFFHKIDTELLRKLREQFKAEQDLDRLADQSGIRNHDLLKELLGQGMTPENLLVLWLVPLSQVAWADGSVDPNERKAVENALASKGFSPESPMWHLFESWLDHPPSEGVIEAWREYAVSLLDKTVPEQRARLKHELMERAREVARAAGGALNLGAVSRAEEAVLRQIEEVIGE